MSIATSLVFELIYYNQGHLSPMCLNPFSPCSSLTSHIIFEEGFLLCYLTKHLPNFRSRMRLNRLKKVVCYTWLISGQSVNESMQNFGRTLTRKNLFFASFSYAENSFQVLSLPFTIVPAVMKKILTETRFWPE